jgi:excisionase family DNA binding protein
VKQASVNGITNGRAKDRRAKTISTPDVERRLNRVEEAAEYMRVSATKMRQLGWSREIPYIQERSGTLMFFDQADLNRWIDAHKKSA